MTRPAGYKRVSDAHKQKDRWSLPSQHEAIARYCAAHGWEEPIWYTEAHTAKDDDPDKRPVFRQILADARALRFDTLVVVKVDRFARSVVAGYEAAARFERAGVRVVTLDDGDIDLEDPENEFTFGLRLLLARRENKVLGKRVKAGLTAARAAGQWVTKVPFGATIGPDGRLAIDPEESLVLARILREAATEPDSQIAARLTDEDITPPGPRKGASRWGASSGFWWPETVHKIVKHGGWLANMPAPWPDLWVAAYDRPRPVIVRTGFAVRMLSGLAVCPCGGRLGYSGRKERKNLICRNPARGGNGWNCGIRRHHAGYYEALVADAIRTLPDPAKEHEIVSAADPAAWAKLAADRRKIDFRYSRDFINEEQADALLGELKLRESALPRGGTELVMWRAAVVPILRKFDRIDPADQNGFCRLNFTAVECAGDEIRLTWRPEAKAVFRLPG